MKPRRNERQRIISRLDKLVSKCVRLSHADNHGLCRCYTCGLVRHWKTVDCGHWIGRGKYPTRWDVNNLRPQCKRCNKWGRKGESQRHPYRPFIGPGEPAIFENRLRREGIDCDALLEKSTGGRPTMQDMEELEDHLKQCLAGLLQKYLDCEGVEWESV